MDKPPPARNPAGGVIRRRPAAKAGSEGGVEKKSGQPDILKFYDQDAPGIKM